MSDESGDIRRDDVETALPDDSMTEVDGGWFFETADGHIFRGPGRLQPGDLERAMDAAGYRHG